MYKEKIEAYFADKQDQILADIDRLVRIRSVREDPKEGKPFGDGPCAALNEAQKMIEEYGFHTKNFDNYVVSAEMNDKPAYLGMLAHMDVVHEGTGWTYPPYEVTAADGRIYGRGTADDKGPAVVALWAMKAAKEINPNMSKGCRLIFGSAEETGSEDLDYYLPKEPAPPFSFSPDAEYPVINIEKGGYRPIFGAKWEEDKNLPRVASVQGGTTTNIVTRECDAYVEGLSMQDVKAAADKWAEKTGVEFTVTVEKGQVHIHTLGVSAHAAAPETGKNAQIAMIGLLADLPMAESRAQKALRDLAKLFPFGDNHGTALGVDQEDDISGRLTLVLSKFKFDLNGFEAQFDSRCPICANASNMSDIVKRAFAECGFEIFGKGEMYDAHHTPGDCEFCQTLLSVYEQYTGEKGECVAIGGGTYVHDIEGGVAFGCSMPGTDNRMHGADEFAVIDELMISAKMFTEVILRLCE